MGNLYPPHHFGGYEVAWQSAVEHLRRRGHEARVLTTTFELPERSGEDPDPSVRRALQWYWRDGEWPRLSALERLRLERHNARVMERQLREWRPDVVCWWAMGGMSLSLIERVRRHGLPGTFVVCDDWLLYAPQVDAWLRAMRRLGPAGGAIARLAGVPARVNLEAAGEWLFLSDTLRSRALAAGWSLRCAGVCGRGVERDLFRPAPPREWRWQLAYVGRVERRKGVDLAVEALEHLPGSSELVVDGRGSEEDLAELRGLVRSRGLEGRVRFANTPRERLRETYAGADAVLFPVRWMEPWGLVPLESMAVGTPVVATGMGGSGEYLHDGHNCVLFDPEAGPEALAVAVRRLADDPDLRARIRERGFATSSRFPEDQFDHAVEALIERAVAEPVD